MAGGERSSGWKTAFRWRNLRKMPLSPGSGAMSRLAAAGGMRDRVEEEEMRQLERDCEESLVMLRRRWVRVFLNAMDEE